ncbi:MULTISPECIES: PRC-barrel domain-containing protein [Actinoplanes]|uniref:PRC-barrel domain-containing protein n=1 Tax=Actinoplanes TaxID=1865 RepID=UPI0005F2A802|nr:MULTISPECIES: PRC-barrel domain-containing protein [Actinoplanes]GLY01324.1 hypothetical protein Acsp01_17030 [Actinoplanes sp. NBRC 101535]
MTQHRNTTSEDLGAPVAYLVVKNGTPVYDRSGATVGTVEHVLADVPEDIFHGLLLETGLGHRFAAADRIDGLFEQGVIVSEPAENLPEPDESQPAMSGLRRAWDWLIQPKG